MKPKVFLSYRHNLAPEIAGKEVLIQTVDADQTLDLVFDKSVTVVGDSVTAFMEELIATRCVFVFISEDYFKSAYTLFELIAVHRHEEAARKMILPVCLSEQMIGVYNYTDIETYWHSNQSVQDVLATLLRTSGRSAERVLSSTEMLAMIREAWEAIVFPYLNTLRDSDAAYDVTALIQKVVADYAQHAATECEKTKAGHHNLIAVEIGYLLEDHPVIKAELIKVSRPLRSSRSLVNVEFAKRLLGDSGEAARSLGELTNAARQIRETLGKDSEEWRRVFKGIQQLCGCLLLNTIDPVWWFNQELELRRQAEHCVTGSGYQLDHASFVEVVVSKELLSRGEMSSPSFSHDPKGTGGVVPSAGVADYDYNNMMMFDAVNVDAVAHSLLGDIHQDLLRSTQVPQDVDQLMKDIRDRAKGIKNASYQRPVYYIVSHDYLQQVQAQPWFTEFETLLKGSLQFICCNQQTLSDNRGATKESQTQLLSAVGLLLNLNKD